MHSATASTTTLDVAGFTNDNTGTSLYEVQRDAIALTTEWALVTFPVPDPSRLGLERGLFFFAESRENNRGYTIWFDEIRFARVGLITSPRLAVATRTVDSFVGATVIPEQTRVTFSVNGEDVTVNHSPGYFTYASSDESVATTEDGVIRVVGGGNAVITARWRTSRSAPTT
jgi:hypothetical protein